MNADGALSQTKTLSVGLCASEVNGGWDELRIALSQEKKKWVN